MIIYKLKQKEYVPERDKPFSTICIKDHESDFIIFGINPSDHNNYINRYKKYKMDEHLTSILYRSNQKKIQAPFSPQKNIF